MRRHRQGAAAAQGCPPHRSCTRSCPGPCRSPTPADRRDSKHRPGPASSRRLGSNGHVPEPRRRNSHAGSRSWTPRRKRSARTHQAGGRRNPAASLFSIEEHHLPGGNCVIFMKSAVPILATGKRKSAIRSAKKTYSLLLHDVLAAAISLSSISSGL